MLNLHSVEGVLDFAIANEIEAYQFYMDLAGKVNNPVMKAQFQDFAEEEKRHREKLEAVKTGKIEFKPKGDAIKTLNIADYTVEVEPVPDVSYQGALMVAMQKEKAAFKLYSDLAAAAQSDELRNLFLALAQEEAKHKLRFEIEYDNEINREN